LAAKILESSSEYVVSYNDISLLTNLGFKLNEDPEEENEDSKALDDFIGSIPAIFNSLLEGPDKKETLHKMATTLQFNDLKNRMLNKFGAFLI